MGTVEYQQDPDNPNQVNWKATFTREEWEKSHADAKEFFESQLPGPDEEIPKGQPVNLQHPDDEEPTPGYVVEMVAKVGGTELYRVAVAGGDDIVLSIRDYITVMPGMKVFYSRVS